jgi:hypothetical protein
MSDQVTDKPIQGKLGYILTTFGIAVAGVAGSIHTASQLETYEDAVPLQQVTSDLRYYTLFNQCTRLAGWEQTVLNNSPITPQFEAQARTRCERTTTRSMQQVIASSATDYQAAHDANGLCKVAVIAGLLAGGFGLMMRKTL